MRLFWKLVSLFLAIHFGKAYTKDESCPNYQYKCPECPEGTECVYPDSGGCPGAGMPVCQSYNCHGVVCLIRALPCPEECPYSCQYLGPSCCPFIGQPECHTCETSVPCHETPCPDDCPDDCFYPDADYCCPKSGEPVCRHYKSSIEASAGPSKPIDKREYFNISPSKPSSGWFYQPELDSGNSVPPSSSLQFSDALPGAPLQESTWDHSVMQPSASKPRDWFYQPSGSPLPQPWFYQPIPSLSAAPVAEAIQAIGKIEQRCDYPCPDIPVPTWGSCAVHQEPDECCPWVSCVDEPLSFDPSKTSPPSSPTTSDEEDPVFCADYIYPCPPGCPEKCNYPQNVPCPFQHKPACPPVEPLITTSCFTVEILSTPDVDSDQVTRVDDERFVTITLTEFTNISEPVVCPMVIFLCPHECPDNCIRPTNVPCPYAVPPHCPGESPPEGIISVIPV